MIEVQNVEKNINGVQVLKNITFSISQGEFVFIVGKSGAGKSTLLDCLSARKKVSSGKITYNGKTLSSKEVGRVFQDFRLLEDMTVLENICYPLEVESNLSQSEIEQKARCYLEKFHLMEKEKNFPREISGGEMQRVGIIRALMMSENLLIADEPTSNLDPKTSEEVMDMLYSLSQSGVTVVVSTHDVRFLTRYKNTRMIEMSNGMVVRDE